MCVNLYCLDENWFSRTKLTEPKVLDFVKAYPTK